MAALLTLTEKTEVDYGFPVAFILEEETNSLAV
jgi:hypothetical protein